jgi:hypothetical protein
MAPCEFSFFTLPVRQGSVCPKDVAVEQTLESSN